MSTTTTNNVTADTPRTWVYLERREDSPYKQLWVRGSCFLLAAQTAYNMYRDPESPQAPEKIADTNDLPIEAVREAISYGQANPPEVQEDRAMDDARIRKRLHEACHMTMCAAPPCWPWKYLIPKCGSSYRQFVIKDRYVRAWTLFAEYVCEREPHTLDEIAANWDVPLEAVLEALAYCSIDPPEIEEEWQRDRESMEARGMNDPNYKQHGQPRALAPQELAPFRCRTHEAVP